MANWNIRVAGYRKELTTLQRAGWLSQSDVQRYWTSKTDKAYQQGLGLGRNRRDVAIFRVKHSAGLKRTGGLTQPGRVIPSTYYERYLGLTKLELSAFKRVPVWTRESAWKKDRGSYNRWTKKVPDIEYVIRQRWHAEYDPNYARNKLNKNRQWELQSRTVDKYVSAVRGYYKGTLQQRQQAVATERARHTPAQQTRVAKASRQRFGAGTLVLPTLSQTAVGKSVKGNATQGSLVNMTRKINGMLGVQSVQPRVKRAKPVRGTVQKRQIKAGKAKAAATARVTKAKPKPGVRIKW